jgi:hypothetical protein
MATPDATRARASERARIAAGGRRICVVLSPDATRILGVIVEALDCTATEAVEIALASYQPPD